MSRSIYVTERVTVEVEVDLAKVDVQDLRDEIMEREQGTEGASLALAFPCAVVGERTEMQQIRAHILAGRNDRAVDLFYPLLRDALGMAI